MFEKLCRELADFQFPRSLIVRDRTLHLILCAVILVLASTTVYFRFYWHPLESYQEAFLSNIERFDVEHASQGKTENAEPGSVYVPILIYHSVRPHSPAELALQRYYDVAPGAFENQLRYLKEHGYTVISLDYLGIALDQNITLPPKSVVITFDDGWRNQYSYAFPLLRKYGYTATFFIFTDAIGRDNFLTWDQIRVVNNSGMTIGGHTRTHPYLFELTNMDSLRQEIIGGKRIIEDQIGHSIQEFAYPFGQYDDRIIGVVKEAGYQFARSTHRSVYNAKSDLFTLKGVEITDDFDQFVADLNQ